MKEGMEKKTKSPKTKPPRVHYGKNLSDGYQSFVKKQKEIGIKVFPTLSQYRDFVRYFFHEMYIAIIWKDYTWVTPIGTFYINGRKRPKGLVPLKNYFNEATGSWEVRKTISKVSSRKMYKMKWDISDVRGVYF